MRYKSNDTVLIALMIDTCLVFDCQKGGLTPLHIAAAIPGEEGVHITQLLLDSLANPDESATEDDSFLNTSLVRDRLELSSFSQECTEYAFFLFLILIMVRCIFIRGSLKIHIFKVLFWERGVTK